MAGATQTVGNVVETQAPQNQHATKDLSQALKEAVRHLSEMVKNALKTNGSHNTQAAPSTAPLAPQPAQGAERATTGNAANPAAPPRAFDAKKWLTQECERLKNALGEKTNNEQELQAIYNLAVSLSSSSARLNLPQDLHDDIGQNIQLIQNFFQAPQYSHAITPEELKFLCAYITFLKAWVDANPDLNKNLKNVLSALQKALPKPQNPQQAEQNNTTQPANQTGVQPRDANIPQPVTSNPAQVQTTGDAGLSRSNQTVTDGLAIAQDSQQQATNSSAVHFQTATAHTNDDEQDVALTSVRSFNQGNAADQNAAPNLTTASSITSLSPDGVQTQGDVQTQGAANNIARVVEPITIQQATLQLLQAANTLELRRALRTTDTTLTAPLQSHLEQTRRQLSDTVHLLYAIKNVDKDWVKHSVHFQKLANNLANNPNTETSLPADFVQQSGPQNSTVNELKVHEKTVYEHAQNILLTNTNNNARFAKVQKILACQVLGHYSAMQAVRNSDPESHYKSSVQMTSAAQLLAAVLTGEEATNSETNPQQQLKTKLTVHAERFGLKTVKEHLEIASDDATPDELKSLFLNGVTLAMAKANEECQPSLATLLERSKTNRTYEKDVTALSGNSRQKIFQESMFRAVALLSDLNATVSDNDPNDSRLNRSVRDANALSFNLLNINDQTTQDRLNFGNPATTDSSDELLNQLMLASMVNNDLSLNERHVSRGSMMMHINKFHKHAQREILKNHNLYGYKTLGEFLVNAAIQMRPQVNQQIGIITRLPSTDGLPSNREIERLVKQIIVTTDAKAAGNEHFKFRELISTAESLTKSRSTEDLSAFQKVLTDIQTAWEAAKEGREANSPLKPAQWVTRDQRSAVSRVLKSNPVKSIPYINQIPLVGRLAAIASELAKGLLAATAGAAGGSVVLGAGAIAVAGLIGGAIVAAPLYGTYRALQETF